MLSLRFVCARLYGPLMPWDLHGHRPVGKAEDNLTPWLAIPARLIAPSLGELYRLIGTSLLDATHYLDEGGPVAVIRRLPGGLQVFGVCDRCGHLAQLTPDTDRGAADLLKLPDSPCGGPGLHLCGGVLRVVAMEIRVQAEAVDIGSCQGRCRMI